MGSTDPPFPLLLLPDHVLVRVLASLGHGSICRAARSCAALSSRELVDDAARLAIERCCFSAELLACAPLTAARRWIHVFGELGSCRAR